MRTSRSSVAALVLVGAALAGLPAVPAAAANYDLKEITPAVQRALDGRKSRYDELRRLKSQGAVGETNQGLVEVRANAPGAAEQVEAENRDRLVIYQAIVDQNQLGPQGLDLVKAAFAEVQREKAQPGDPIQSLSGEWTRK